MFELRLGSKAENVIKIKAIMEVYFTCPFYYCFRVWRNWRCRKCTYI